jgi:hypothetical protein
MKKLCIILTMLLIINLSFANPRPDASSGRSSGNKIQLAFLGLFTAGLGLFIYKAITFHKKVEFVEEQIDITLKDDNSVEVMGEYKFIRTSQAIKNYKIIYPFPAQKEYGEVDIIEVTLNGKKQDFLQFELQRKDRISLELYFADSDECVLKIKFVQKPLKDEYKYILKTTRKWKRALQSSEIDLRIAADLELKNCNYRLNEIKGKDETLSSFQLKEKNFYPDEDFEITWIVKN